MSPPKASSPLARPPDLRLNSGSGEVPTQASLKDRPVAARQDSSSGRSLIPQRPPTSSGSRIQTPPTPGTPGFYGAGIAGSSERLLPPLKPRTHRFRDDEYNSPLASPALSGYSSRRTSWSSDNGSRDSRVYGANPFDDSRAPSRAGSDDDNLNTQTVSEKYNILPSAGLLLFPEDVEKDDYLHNPDPNDKDRDCDVFTRRGMMNVGGLAFVILGTMILFIVYPVLCVPNVFACQTIHIGLLTI